MNMLLGELPQTVTVAGEEVPIDWGYRAFILIEICMFDHKRSNEQKILDALNIFYKSRIPDDYRESIEKLLWFYRCGKNPGYGKGKGTQSGKRSYCFEQDSALIYSAFLTQYHIDLNDTPNAALHWWKFKAMFEALSEDLKLSKIMYYRTVNTNGMSKEKKKFIKEMKNLYALDSGPVETIDSKLKLEKRNQEMKAYVRRRVVEALHDK